MLARGAEPDAALLVVFSHGNVRGMADGKSDTFGRSMTWRTQRLSQDARSTLIVHIHVDRLITECRRRFGTNAKTSLNPAYLRDT